MNINVVLLIESSMLFVAATPVYVLRLFRSKLVGIICDNFRFFRDVLRREVAALREQIRRVSWLADQKELNS